jgi:cell division protein FtsB
MSEEEPKLSVNKAEIAKLVKEYKKIKKYQKTTFAQIKKLS